MSDRVKVNVLRLTMGAAYVWGGYKTVHIGHYVPEFLFGIGIISLGVAFLDIVTPRDADNLHLTP